MTPLTEQQKSDNVAAVKAHLEGKPFDYEHPIYLGEWKRANPLPNFKFDFTAFHFRPSPVPVTRWWNRPEDVPAAPAVWVQLGPDGALRLVTGLDSGGVYLNGLCYRWSVFAEYKATFSLDRKTWQPCTVTEEAK